MIKPISLGLGSNFGSGNQISSWIHVQDLAAMYLLSVINSWEGTYNAVAPFPVSNRELTEELARKLDRPLWLPAIPRVVMKIILGDMHELLFNDKKISAKKMIDAGFQFQYPTIEKALDEILP